MRSNAYCHSKDVTQCRAIKERSFSTLPSNPRYDVMAKFYTSENEDMKAAVVERFNKTLKRQCIAISQRDIQDVSVDVLPDLTYSYNRTYRRSIGMTPIDVTPDNEDVVRARLYPVVSKTLKWKFKVGDKVRITKRGLPFENGYVGRWSEEVFLVKARLPMVPVTYRLTDLSGEAIKGSFYNDELQIVVKLDEALFEIGLILRTRKRADKVAMFCCDASRDMYEDYYTNQHGDGMPVFAGARHQRGHGLGNVFGGLLRNVLVAIATSAIVWHRRGGCHGAWKDVWSLRKNTYKRYKRSCRKYRLADRVSANRRANVIVLTTTYSTSDSHGFRSRTVLRVFQVRIKPPTQTRVKYGNWIEFRSSYHIRHWSVSAARKAIEYHPLTTVSDGTPIEFEISGNGEDYIDLANSMLYVQAKIVKPDGTDLKAASPTNLFLHSLFSQVDISLNGTQAMASMNTYPYRAMLETLLTKTLKRRN